MQGDIPVSVVIVTKNEAQNLPRCLSALGNFSEIYIVDSHSADGTKEIAESYGANFVPFSWNGRYPKKRQWCLDTLPFKHDYVFFVDADEEVMPSLIAEIAALDFSCDGYFVKGAYVVEGRVLRHGLKNDKLCLINRHTMCFPVLDDLDIDGMGEVEGHYQPVFKDGVKGKAGHLRHALLHHAYDDLERYRNRHDGYKNWEDRVRIRGGNFDPVAYRQFLKRVFTSLPAKNVVAFLHSYVLLSGFLDGRAGYTHAKRRYDYYTRRKAR